MSLSFSLSGFARHRFTSSIIIFVHRFFADLFLAAFKCPLALCPKTFAVRSNARRHLRTHGITVPPNALNKNGQGRNQEEPFQVGVETPVVVDVQDPAAGDFIGEGAGTGSGGRPPKLRWVPPSLATRTNAPRLRSLSPTSDMADIDARDASFAGGIGDGNPNHTNFSSDAPIFTRRAPGLRIAPAPLPPAVPSADEGAADLNARFDERNSYAEAGTYPYHPDQVSRVLHNHHCFYTRMKENCN